MTRQFRLNDGRQTMVLGLTGDALPEVVYWGAALPDDEDLATVQAAAAIDMTGGSLDANPPLSLCPEESRTFPGQPGIVLRDGAGRPLVPRFAFQRAETDAGLALHYRDAAAGLTLSFSFRTDTHTHIITCQTRLTADAPIYADWLAAPVLPAPQQADEMIDFGGRWCGEFQVSRTPWAAGIRARDNRTGRTGHEHFPALLVPARGTTNCKGDAVGFHYGWPGGHRMIAEELADGRRQVQFGHASRSDTAPGTAFETAPLYVTWSGTGLNGCAVSFQRHLRDRIVTWTHPGAPRPVHYNCWEAITFNHDMDVLKEMADRAAAAGAERFVLDDGWFGRRDNDDAALGDWTVDARKYPNGLSELIDHVKGLGLSFGIWFEPEMVNADSDLFRAHPDWVLGPLDQPLGRQQYVLDMAKAQVRDNLFAQISAILSAHDISYVKWDHNRVLPHVDANQTRGTLDLLARLRAAFPAVEIETCASGGGRIDFGILQHTQRVWLSDCNDALERLRIQHDAALFLPMAVTGSHVGPRHCHTTGRIHDIAFRAWVAAQRHMGFEMDPRELDAREMAVLQKVSGWFKANRDWMMQADIFRLDAPDPAIIAEQQTAPDAGRFVVFAGRAASSRQIAPRPLQLTALDPAAVYRVDLANRDEITGLSRGATALRSGALEVSGAYLMSQGLTLPWLVPDSMWVVEGVRQ